ncbi:homoprotocatechuate degradation operon regulator HpaR [Ruegeria arenilitoris]|uniref:homoprotocatechuate degradation operon regulator HpaR n=1 Tax=Ruegeria arenilitoris TaxID=1173585 RepID=UPI0020C3956C|nr:homoprotocatechuate degradation operon regulator HpaR [Ruegeria arenilitoris]
MPDAPQNRKAKTLPTTTQSLPVSLIRAREAVMAPIRKMLQKAGITEQQWRVLRVLSENGKTDAGMLANRAALMSPSLSRIIQSMENSGLVSREADPNDRRRQHIAITASGQAIIDSHLAEASDIAAYYRDILGDDDHDTLVALLQKLALGLDDQNQDT